MDSVGESIDLLQSVLHQTSSSASSSSSSTLVTAAVHHHHPTIVSPASSTSRPASSNQRAARLVAGDVDEEEDLELRVEPATTRHCHCCCQHATQRRRAGVRRADVTDGRGFRQRRSAADDDDDADSVSWIERGDHLVCSSDLYLPPRGSDVRETGDESTPRQARWWTRLFCRRRHEDVARRRRHGDADDCWRLFPPARARSRDAGATVDVGQTSAGRLGRRDEAAAAALLTHRHKPMQLVGGACTRVLCVIVSGLCVALAGLVVGAALVIATSECLLLRHCSTSRSTARPPTRY